MGREKLFKNKVKDFIVPFFIYPEFKKYLDSVQGEVEWKKFPGIDSLEYEETHLVVFVGIKVKITGQFREVQKLFKELEKRN